MGTAAVLLAIVSLAMCAVSLIWDGEIIVDNNNPDREYVLFQLFRTCVVVPTIILLLFVFSAHLDCDDAEARWNVTPHDAPCPKCSPRQPPKAEADLSGKATATGTNKCR